MKEVGTDVDVVVVAYNSRDTIRDCVEPLLGRPGIRVIVIDNASPDQSGEALGDLPLVCVRMPRNGGFSYGCNAGWRIGTGPYVLFLNPDAVIEPEDVLVLATALDADPSTGLIGPLIRNSDGTVHHSQRRFPRVTSSLARAFWIHRLFPNAYWSDEVQRAPRLYGERNHPEWISGACFMVRRTTLEEIGGFDESFFLYSEDIDICRRVWDAGLRVTFEPAAECRHQGGASAPRASLLPVMARSRVRYARAHGGRGGEVGQRLGIVVEASVRIVAGRGGAAARRGHLGAIAVALRPLRGVDAPG